MKKSLIIATSVMVMFSNCGTYTETGAYVGTTLGSILGSAIGGISDGPRGSDIGTIIGMAGGAVIGAAIGSAADKREEEQWERCEQRRAQKKQRQDDVRDCEETDDYDSGFDESNSGDDRIYDFNGSEYTGSYSAQQPVESATSSDSKVASGSNDGFPLEIRNARFVDDNKDKVINGGELCKVIFEVVNVSNQTLYDVQPVVAEVSGLKHLAISPSIHIEKLLPGKKIRYTALVQAGKRIKNSTAKICLSVVQGNNNVVSKITEFNIPTRK